MVARQDSGTSRSHTISMMRSSGAECWTTAGLLLGEDATVDRIVEEEVDLRSGDVGVERDGRAAPRWCGASLLQGPAASLSCPPGWLWSRRIRCNAALLSNGPRRHSASQWRRGACRGDEQCVGLGVWSSLDLPRTGRGDSQRRCTVAQGSRRSSASQRR
jgi:hypothetical protein